MSMLIKALALGVAIALLGVAVAVVPGTLTLETELGLAALFRMRGPRPAPPEVVVVSIDRESSERLGLSQKPRKWPRSHHAQLVRKLSRAGARVIAFDVIFEEPQGGEEDRLFADTLRETGNVILFEYLKKETRTLAGAAPGAVALEIETRVPPIPELARAAAGLAPFPLPKVPARVNQVWLFKRSAGDVGTLPVVALQRFAMPYYGSLWCALEESAAARGAPGPPCAETRTDPRDLGELVHRLRARFHSDPAAATRLLDGARKAGAEPLAERLHRTLLELYRGADSRYVDFYGPPRSITTVPYHRVLDAGPAQLSEFAGKAVFVGFSEQLQPEQKDGFYTVFSRRDGLDVSGVEIAASAFANLLEGRSVRPLSPGAYLLLIALWGFAGAALFTLLPGTGSLAAALAAGALFVTAAGHLFAADGTWLPLVVPLLLQLPLALLGALALRYLVARRERRLIHNAMGHYLPANVVAALTRGDTSVTSEGRRVYGICLASDAEQYTALAEAMDPAQLRALLNRYYETLFAPVRSRGGIISDVVGDAMLAIWAARAPDRELREQACLAALEIVAAVEPLDRSAAEYPPTRIGLHCGELLLGDVGAGDHYEYRAVGDIVNTATRIESLNKQLGTRVLASRETVAGLDVATRELGRFRLAGKSRELEIHELLAPAQAADAATRGRRAAFADALQAFRARRFAEAAATIETALARWGDDGPSRYYLALCRQYAQRPPAPAWDGVIAPSRG